MDIEIYLNKEFAELVKEASSLYGIPVSKVARLVFTHEQNKDLLKQLIEQERRAINDRTKV